MRAPPAVLLQPCSESGWSRHCSRCCSPGTSSRRFPAWQPRAWWALSVARWIGGTLGASRATCIATIVFGVVDSAHVGGAGAGSSRRAARRCAVRGRGTGRAARPHNPRGGCCWASRCATAPVGGQPVADGTPDRRARAAAVGRVVVVPARTPDDSTAPLLLLVRCLGRSSQQRVSPRSLPARPDGVGGTRAGRAGARVDPDLGHDLQLAIHEGFYLAAILPVATWLAVRLYLPRSRPSPLDLPGRRWRRPGPPGRRPNLQSVA